MTITLTKSGHHQPVILIEAGKLSPSTIPPTNFRRRNRPPIGNGFPSVFAGREPSAKIQNGIGSISKFVSNALGDEPISVALRADTKTNTPTQTKATVIATSVATASGFLSQAERLEM